MVRVWQATVHGVTKSQTWRSNCAHMHKVNLHWDVALPRFVGVLTSNYTLSSAYQWRISGSNKQEQESVLKTYFPPRISEIIAQRKPQVQSDFLQGGLHSHWSGSVWVDSLDAPCPIYQNDTVLIPGPPPTLIWLFSSALDCLPHLCWLSDPSSDVVSIYLVSTCEWWLLKSLGTAGWGYSELLVNILSDASPELPWNSSEFHNYWVDAAVGFYQVAYLKGVNLSLLDTQPACTDH